LSSTTARADEATTTWLPSGPILMPIWQCREVKEIDPEGLYLAAACRMEPRVVSAAAKYRT
jgi:hypothetical protein